jgi:hypothetical protein
VFSETEARTSVSTKKPTACYDISFAKNFKLESDHKKKKFQRKRENVDSKSFHAFKNLRSKKLWNATNCDQRGKIMVDNERCRCMKQKDGKDLR